MPRPRLRAALEVALCSDLPTQWAIGALVSGAGLSAIAPGGGLRLAYVVAVSLLDSVALLTLVALLLRIGGEPPRAVLLGGRPGWSECRAGGPLLVGAFAIAAAVLVPIRLIAPWLHTVERNPLQALVHTPQDALLLGVVVVVAGGIREEVQRAFLLHRFEQALGGARLGLVVTSVAFGAGHLLQGADAAIATAWLGAYWGAAWLRRRSVIAPVVSHAGFNVLQVAQMLWLVR